MFHTKDIHALQHQIDNMLDRIEALYNYLDLNYETHSKHRTDGYCYWTDRVAVKRVHKKEE